MAVANLIDSVPQTPASMSAANPNPEDTERRSNYAEAAAFWDGLQWQTRPVKATSTRLVINYARLVLRKAVSYAIGDTVNHAVIAEAGLTEDAAEAIERRFAAELDAAGAADLDPQLLLDASIYGEAACKITWSADQRRIILAPIHPNQINIWSDPADRYTPVRAQHGYYLPGWSVPAHFGLPPSVANGSTDDELYPVIEEWTPQRWTVTVNGQPLIDAPNPYGLIPFALVINEPRTGRQWGQSDLIDLYDVCRELNRRISTVSNVLELSGAPIAVLENVDSSERISAEPGAIWELPPDAKAYLLDLLQGGGVDLHIKQIGELRTTLHDLSETPRTAFGDTGRAVSGAALEVELQPLVQKVRRKRGAMTRFYRRRNAIALALMHQFGDLSADPTAIRTQPLYPAILPSDTEADARTAATLVASGITSRQKAAAALGSTDPAGDFEEWLTEASAIAANAAAPADQSATKENPNHDA